MNRFIKAFFVIIFVFVLGACEMEYSTPPATQTCDLHLQLFVHQGTSVAHTFSGSVKFDSHTWNSFQGEMVEETGRAYPISFAFDGQAIHFIVDTEKGRVFASGMMESGLAICAGSGGGTLSGPLVGDLGDWRGEWVATTLPTPLVQSTPSGQGSNKSMRLASLLICIYSPIIVLGLFLAIFLVRAARSSKRPTSK